MDGKPITWRCHVCGEERFDDAISVLTTTVRLRNLPDAVKQNVRYCNDRPSCASGAVSVRFISDERL